MAQNRGYLHERLIYGSLRCRNSCTGNAVLEG